MFTDDSAGLREGQGRLAKNSDHLTDSFDADNTGGVLSGLLAEEDDLDRRALWRIGSWGIGAVAAVVVAVMANQSSLGLKREQMAATELARQAQQIQMAARETQSETRRLANAVDTLNSDRDRLYTRVTSLEQGLDSVTGSFIRQLPPNAPIAPLTLPAVEQSPAPVVGPVASAAPAIEKPASKAPDPSPATVSSVAKDAPKSEPGKSEKAEAFKADVAKLEAAKTDMAKADAAKAEAAKTEAAKADIAKTEAASAKAEAIRTEAAKPEAAKTPAATPATPLVAAKSFMAPPDPSATKLIEPNKPVSPVTAAPIPEVVATAPVSDEEADEATAPKVALQRTEFGVDLGTANSVNGLRALWRGLLKSRSNAPLQALRPVIKIKESTNGLGMQLHLVAGPLNDAGAAAKICAVMTENKRNCETTVFDGQRLSMGNDEVTPTAPETTKPNSRSRRGYSKRAATSAAPAAAEEPKKPETTSSIASSISSMFNRKKPE